MLNMNNEHSQNFYTDIIDVNSQGRSNNIMKQQSMNMRICFTNDYSREMGIEDIYDLDVGNTINFFELSRHNLFNHVFHNKQLNKAESLQFEKQLSQAQFNKKKGLKYLAWIINRLLRKHKYENNQIVNECIRQVLIKSNDNVKEISIQDNYKKQTQNIRRRIYDAINVMSAIGLINKQSSSFMQISKPQNPISCRKIMNSFQQMNTVVNNETFQNLKKIVNKKLECIKTKLKYLQKKKQQILAYKLHMQRNGNILLKQKQTKSKISDLQIDRFYKKCEGIQFPFIMIGAIGQQISIICHGKNINQITIKHKKNKMLFYSQLDAIHKLHQCTINNITTEGTYHDYLQRRKKLKNNENYHEQLSEMEQADYFSLNNQTNKFDCKTDKLAKSDQITHHQTLTNNSEAKFLKQNVNLLVQYNEGIQISKKDIKYKQLKQQEFEKYAPSFFQETSKKPKETNKQIEKL